MRNKILLTLLFVCCIAMSGCYLLQTKTNPSGKEVTNLESVLVKTQTGINTIAPIVNTFVPGVGTIATGFGGLLALVGGMVTSIVVAKRRGGALAAVIKGVETVSNKETKESIKEIAGSLGIEKYLNKAVKRIFPV